LYVEREAGAFIPSAPRVKPNHGVGSIYLIPQTFCCEILLWKYDRTVSARSIKDDDSQEGVSDDPPAAQPVLHHV
jgi:hypothetical protein